MSDIFFEANERDPGHWRYWKSRVKRDDDGQWIAKVHGEWTPVVDSRFIDPRTLHEAARIAAYSFGGAAPPDGDTPR